MAQASTICAHCSNYKEFVQKLTNSKMKKTNRNLYMTIFLSFQKRNLQHKVILENYSRFNIEIRISVFAEICKLGRYLREIIHNSSLLNNV